ncbi:MAG: DUF4112 domain-containing protein [Dehalococcoidia bacterium]
MPRCGGATRTTALRKLGGRTPGARPLDHWMAPRWRQKNGGAPQDVYPVCLRCGPASMGSASALSRSQQRTLATSRRLARFMDAQWGVGPVRFGADAVIGLIPGVGDVATVAVALYQIAVAYHLGLPAGLLLRMAANIAVDVVVGLVPVLGDITDTFFKAHLRNQRLVEDWLANQDRGARR